MVIFIWLHGMSILFRLANESVGRSLSNLVYYSCMILTVIYQVIFNFSRALKYCYVDSYIMSHLNLFHG
jgi:hypothetical protein